MILSASCNGILTLGAPFTKSDVIKYNWSNGVATPETVSLQVQQVINMELSGQNSYIDTGYDTGRLWKTIDLGDYLYVNINGREVKISIVHDNKLEERIYRLDISSWDPIVVGN